MAPAATEHMSHSTTQNVLLPVEVHRNLRDVDDLKEFDVVKELDGKWRQWEAVGPVEPQTDLQVLHKDLNLGHARFVRLLCIQCAQLAANRRHAPRRQHRHARHPFAA